MEQLYHLLKGSGHIMEEVAKRTYEPDDGGMWSKRYFLGMAQALYVLMNSL